MVANIGGISDWLTKLTFFKVGLVYTAFLPKIGECGN